MANPFFPSFLSGKKRLVKGEHEVSIEPEAQTEQVVEDEALDTKRYIFLFYLIIGVVFLSLFLKLFSLQVVGGARYREQAEGNRLRIRATEAPRGIIYDRNKNPLVKNVASFSLQVYPADLPIKKEDRFALYKKLSEDLNIPLSEIEKVEARRNYQEPVVLKEGLSQDEALLLESKTTEMPVVKVVKQPSREYLPKEFSLSHILGYVSESKGKSGLEESYEEYLKGVDGKQSIEVDALGRVTRILAASPAKAGDSLVLSLDLGLQEQMVKSLLSMMEKTKSKAAVAIAADPQTGGILGMVSLPAYDNNLFTKGVKNNEYEKLLKDPQAPLFNRAISGTYPSGSVIKPVVAAAALEEKIINPKTTISDPGVINIVNKYNPSIVYSFPDWKPGGHGRVDVYKAIEQSCDVFFYALGGGWQNIPGLGEKRLTNWLTKFGLGKKTGIDLSGEKEGFIPTAAWKEKVKKEIWYQGDSYHLAIGQGDFLATPLQILNYTIYFANGGIMYKPHFVTEIDTPEGQLVRKIDPEIVAKDLVSRDNVQVVREGMRRVVTSGTARSLSNLPFTVAGKTGTAQNPHGEPHAWFIAFAPYENPKIATVVLIENGGEGSSAAVPVTREILQYWWENKKF
uniref:Penicillin-binding protein 2 n=1 Tax=candidate division CPR3 bacterium TaxID=2268181 RepID=A0A7V3J9Y1_UNCC3